MQTACLRLMGKKLLVALTMEGKFAGEGLQSIDEDDDMLSAMARELVTRNGIGESADAVWKAVNAEHQKLFTSSEPVDDPAISDMPLRVLRSPSDAPVFVQESVVPRPVLIFGRRSRSSGRSHGKSVPEQASLF